MPLIPPLLFSTLNITLLSCFLLQHFLFYFFFLIFSYSHVTDIVEEKILTTSQARRRKLRGKKMSKWEKNAKREKKPNIPNHPGTLKLSLQLHIFFRGKIHPQRQENFFPTCSSLIAVMLMLPYYILIIHQIIQTRKKNLAASPVGFCDYFFCSFLLRSLDVNQINRMNVI